MKGIELPTNTIIVLVMGLFVLILVSVWLVNGFKPLDDTRVESVLNEGCKKLAFDNSQKPEEIIAGDMNGDGKQDKLLDACRLYTKDMSLDSDKCINVCVKKFPGLISAPSE
jgi:hypothetical protein